MSAPEDARYCRLYWRLADEFPEVWNDDAQLSLYARLLRLADMAWPSSATVPFGARPKTLGKLAGAGLVLMQTGTTYRIRGLDKERSRRSRAASNAAVVRWHPDDDADGNAERIADGNAGRNAESMPRQEQSRERVETEKEHEQIAPAQPVDDPVVALADRTGRFPSGVLLKWVNDLAQRYGDAAVTALLRTTPMASGEAANVYLGRVTEALSRTAHIAQQAEAEAERAKVAAQRAAPRPLRLAPDDSPERVARELAELEGVI